MNRNSFFGVLFAIVAAPVSAAPAVETYGRLPAVELMRLAPSGQRYALVTVAGERRSFIAGTFDGKVLASALVGTAKVRGIQWAGDDNVMIMMTSTFTAPLIFRQAYELASVVSIRLADQNLVNVFKGTSGIADAVFGEYGTARVEGALVGYFGGLTFTKTRSGDLLLDHGYADLYRIDLETGKASFAARGSEAPHSWVVATDGTIVAHSEYSQPTGDWRLYRGKGHDDAFLFEVNAPLSDIRLEGQGRTPGAVLVANATGVKDVIEEVSTVDGKREKLFDSVRVERMLHDPDTGLLIGATVQEQPGAVFFDPKLQARFNGTSKAFPGRRMRLVSFSRNLERLIVSTDGGDDSGTFWLVDIASGNADPIGRKYPDIAPADVGATRWIKYTAADGLPIEGVLTLPPGKKPEKLPLVVMPHGGPIGVSDETGFDWWAQAYASAGYAVLQPNFRGSSGYGSEFRRAAFGEWGRKMQTDLSDGVAALAAQGIIDSARVCIVGASYGGYAALAGATLQHGVYRCAVSVAGPANLSSFFSWQRDRHGYQSSATRYWSAVTGADKGGDAAMKAISPTRFAAEASAPILLIHGKDDTVVPLAQSEEMADALKNAHKPVEVVVMDGEDHWLSREATRTTMLKAAVAFVRQHNPSE